jgi:ubiquinone/menaquinone biosynthesis C-methylase UbiE
MTDAAEGFQLSLQAAEAYEERFVPALFADWADALVEAAGIVPGHAVLDVACGTGVVARAAARRLRGAGRVVGVDVNEAMLAVARRAGPGLDWQLADAGDLPFADASFDVVLCQAALMYVPDAPRAVGEMRRVVRAGGTVAVQVWSSLDRQPAYRPFAKIAARHAGDEARRVVGSYFSLGDFRALEALLERSGLQTVASETRLGAMRTPSIDDFVAAEIEGTPLADRLDEDGYRRIREETRSVLASFVDGNGRAAIPIEGHIVVCRRQG